jgi:hypothetical protein
LTHTAKHKSGVLDVGRIATDAVSVKVKQAMVDAWPAIGGRSLTHTHVLYKCPVLVETIVPSEVGVSPHDANRLMQACQRARGIVPSLVWGWESASLEEGMDVATHVVVVDLYWQLPPRRNTESQSHELAQPWVARAWGV